MFKLNLVKISGSEVLPIIEGGKGINVSTGVTAGNFAKSGAVGTFSAVNADSYDDEGNVISQVYDSKLSRKEKFDKLVNNKILYSKIKSNLIPNIKKHNFDATIVSLKKILNKI